MSLYYNNHCYSLHSAMLTVSFSFSALLPTIGECVKCGANTYGQLGYQRSSGHTLPAVVEELCSNRMLCVSCGDTYTIACTDGEE